MKQEMMGWLWHQLDHMQIICTLLQTDNHAPAPHHSIFYMSDALPNAQQCQSTAGNKEYGTLYFFYSTTIAPCGLRGRK